MTDEILVDAPIEPVPEPIPEPIDPRTVPHKLVNGIAVPLSEEELAELEASRPVIERVSIVTMAQAQKALVLSGVALSSVQAALEAIVDPVERELALIDWNKSPTVSSDSDLVVSMAEALSLTADDVAGLFALAESL